MPPVAFFSHGAVYPHNPRATGRARARRGGACSERGPGRRGELGPTRPNRERSPNRAERNATMRSSESSGPDTRPPRRGGTGRLERVPCEPERVSQVQVSRVSVRERERAPKKTRRPAWPVQLQGGRTFSI